MEHRFDVVIYGGTAGGVIAARLVWMLRATGHQAALLDGGLTAYLRYYPSGSGDDRIDFGRLEVIRSSNTFSDVTDVAFVEDPNGYKIELIETASRQV